MSNEPDSNPLSVLTSRWTRYDACGTDDHANGTRASRATATGAKNLRPDILVSD